MSSRNVLFVGLEEEQIATIPLPEGVEVTSVPSSQEATDRLSLTPSDLVVARDRIDDLDSIDFFARIVEADPDTSVPVIFLAPPESPAQPFLCQRTRSGFNVRYLDRDGELHSFFVTEPNADKPFTVRGIPDEKLGEEIAQWLGDEGLGQSEEAVATQEDEDPWQIGFNQNVKQGGTEYHIQTEVVSVDPIVVASTVFSAGAALHAEQHKLKGKQANPARARARAASIHANVVSRVRAGEFAS